MTEQPERTTKATSETMCWRSWQGPCSYWGGDRHGCTKPDLHSYGPARMEAGESTHTHRCGCGSTVRNNG